MVPAETITSKSGEVFERRFVDRDYPYTQPGAIGDVCAEWEIVSRSGVVVDVQREWYPMNTMNRHLGNVGTPDAVAHVDAGFRDALLAEGISRIETCDQAREYVRIGRERMKFVPISELGPPAVLQGEPNIEPGLGPDGDGELVNKVIVGSSFDHPSTVGLAFPSWTCTGQLIGPFAMVTAAHCIPWPGGNVEVRAWIQAAGASQQCVSNPGGGACPPINGTANVYAQMDPNYDTLGKFDEAVIITNPGWYAPANTSARWTRIAYDYVMPFWAGYVSSPIKIAGYGANTTAGGGGGVGRLGNNTPVITSFNAQNNMFYIPRPTAAATGICEGDSGAGANNTAILGSALSLGVLWNSTQPWDGACTAAGQQMIYGVFEGQWVSNLVNYFGGNCQTFTHAASGARYVRCW